MRVGKLIVGMMLAVSAMVPLAGTASAAVTVRRVGPLHSTLVDMTPSGRYLLVRMSSFTASHFERIDTSTNARVRLPAGNWGQITNDGTAVVGVDLRLEHT